MAARRLEAAQPAAIADGAVRSVRRHLPPAPELTTATDRTVGGKSSDAEVLVAARLRVPPAHAAHDVVAPDSRMQSRSRRNSARGPAVEAIPEHQAVHVRALPTDYPAKR